MSSGGGKSTTTYTQNVPKELMPYYSRMMGRGEEASNQPYQAYGGERIAGFDPMQERAQQQAQTQQLPGQLGEGSNIASSTAYGPSGRGLQGYDLQDFAARTGSTAGQQTAGGQYAANQMLRQGQPTAEGQQGQAGIISGMQGSQTGRWTDPGIAGQYMDPYMQQVVDIQKRESNRQFDQQSQNQRAQTAVRGGVGGIGGYRDQLLQAEGNRNQQQALNDIQQKGLQQAYSQGQQTYGADETRALQAAQQRGQLGASLSQEGRAGQNLGLEGLKAYQQQEQYGRSMGLDTAKYMGQLGGQMTDAARQQQAMSLDSAKALAGMGGQQYAMEQGLTEQLDKYGTQRQALQQKYLDQQYQDFQNQRDYEWQNLEKLNSLLHGQNLGGSTQQPGTSPISQLAGTGLTAAAIYKMMNS